MSANTGKIPIKNIWLLMLYAFDFRYGNTKPVLEEKNPEDIVDLIAEVLTHAVQDRLRHGLSVGFERQQADLTHVRGRINHTRTERHHLLRQGKIACSFDELTTDTPSNRYVKAALIVTSQNVQDKELGQRCRTNVVSLEKAGIIKDGRSIAKLLTNSTLPNTSTAKPEDRRMLAAAEMALNLMLPTEEYGPSYLSEPSRKKEWLPRLFEKAIGGFYDIKLTPKGWTVGTSKQIKWQAEQGTENMKDILPRMERDIVLYRPNNSNTHKASHIIIDTKYTDILQSPRYEKSKLKSEHIYQMYAYLRSQEKTDDPSSMTASGMLLYPSVRCDMDESAIIQGHKIRFATIDLATDHKTMAKRLLDLVCDFTDAE